MPTRPKQPTSGSKSAASIPAVPSARTKKNRGEVKVRRSVPAIAAGDGKRRCPVCQEVMVVANHHGTSIDVCDEHGLWLDRGELERIQITVWNRGRLRRDRRRRKDIIQAKVHGMLGEL